MTSFFFSLFSIWFSFYFICQRSFDKFVKHSGNSGELFFILLELFIFPTFIIYQIDSVKKNQKSRKKKCPKKIMKFFLFQVFLNDKRLIFKYYEIENNEKCDSQLIWQFWENENKICEKKKSILLANYIKNERKKVKNFFLHLTYR